jgi:hypothetical protein
MFMLLASLVEHGGGMFLRDDTPDEIAWLPII